MSRGGPETPGGRALQFSDGGIPHSRHPARPPARLRKAGVSPSLRRQSITAKDGGLKLPQIVDNGSGIRRADLPLLAARFCTSKLSTFSDLSKLQTHDSCAWRASYPDGLLAPAKAGTSADPKPCAGNDGTTIAVEISSTPLRLRALKSPSDEYAHILDVVQRYAIHHPSLSFLCKRTGSNTADVSTPSSGTVKSAIKTIYDPSVAKELLEAQAEARPKDEFEWQAEAWFTSANYHAKKPTFLLFINHRSGESARVKKAVEAVYSGILPKGACSSIGGVLARIHSSKQLGLTFRASLDNDPSKVNVNVHPTKREVHFLDEEAITEKVADSMQAVLAANDQSRTFQYQTVLTGHSPFKSQGKMKRSDLRKERIAAGFDEDMEREDELEDEENEQDLDLERPRAGPSSSPKPFRKPSQPSYKKVRNDLETRTLDSMFPVLQSSSESQRAQPNMEIEKKEKAPAVSEMKKGKHLHLARIIDRIDESVPLARSIIHQSIADQSRGSHLTLEPAPSLEELVKLAVDAEAAITEQALNPGKIIKSILKTIMAQRAMLAEYFSLEITSSGEMSTLPLLLPGYTPNLDRLPLFLMRLAPQVNWTSESECCSTFLQSLVLLYERRKPLPRKSKRKGRGKARSGRSGMGYFPRSGSISYLLEGERDVVQVAELKDWYRVFERC
ncbi:hypothetical protein DACRYDRAFT_106555 [Dacryopinax primogenitus]|uniref:DNA mismatch repair protein S5 domain-containing protein n=1 Tax=Dacryopinax primogenitus (strain DJM 731) TaxID=1858805 RepID=M5GBG5_DACPD|nr:uncharacterized protein DACRYDRAFT_106555 [Dacryopinax primogenitus]EJU03397.1 hypothetical protein DACRYDRAFT_106555 [Dacryopinax primogenitus]